MDVDLTGNVALVTGAARGIGLVVARDLASEGVNVCGTDIRADLLQDEMQGITGQYGVETSYSQIWCMPMKSSGDLVRLFDLFSVNEFHTLNDFREVREAA